MDKEILRSRFVRIMFNEESRIYTSTYLPETDQMTDTQWKDQMLELQSIIEQILPIAIIDDNRERLYAYPPEMQLWTLNLFVESWNRIGLKKYVQILPVEILGKLTAHQIEEFATNDFEMDFEYKFVSDYQGATDWVKESVV